MKWRAELRIILVVVLTLSVLLPGTGCTKVKELVEMVKPEIREISHQWGEVTEETTEVLTTIKVYNPNPISLPVKNVSCDILMNDLKMGYAETKELTIEKQAEFPVRISTKIDNSKIPDFWVVHLERGEKSSILIDGEVVFDLKLLDFTFPFKLERPMETDILSELEKVKPITVEKKAKTLIPGVEQTVFKITVKSLSGRWGEVARDSTELDLLATVHNQNPYPLVVPKIVYDVEMNGIALASGETAANYSFAPNSENAISTSVSLSTGLMDKWFVTHIRQGEKSTFDITVSLVFELPGDVAQQLGQGTIVTPGWEITEEFETDLLGTKD